jgi:hypothetical protein
MNWTNLIDDLLQRGHTFRSISDELGVTPAAVRAMMHNAGQQPRWNTGDRLVSLHKRMMRKYPRINTHA